MRTPNAIFGFGLPFPADQREITKKVNSGRKVPSVQEAMEVWQTYVEVCRKQDPCSTIRPPSSLTATVWISDQDTVQRAQLEGWLASTGNEEMLSRQ